MEELPTDVRILIAENGKMSHLVDRVERLLDITPTIELMAVLRDSLVDIKNILQVQNHRLEKLDSVYALEEKLQGLQLHSENISIAVSRLEATVNNFRAKTLSIENATQAMENRVFALDEAAEKAGLLSSAIGQRNDEIAALAEKVSRLAGAVDERSSGMGLLIEGYGASREALENSVSALGAIQETLKDLRSDIFERNQYMNIILSDLAASKGTMERNVGLLETGAVKLVETVEEMNRRTDDILNVTAGKMEELKNLRDALYDDIASVDSRVKKVQKAADRQKKDMARNSKRQTEMLKLVKKIGRKVDRMERQARKKK